MGDATAWKRETGGVVGACGREGPQTKLQKRGYEGMIWADVHPKGTGCEEEMKRYDWSIARIGESIVVKVWSMFPYTPLVDGDPVPRKYRSLAILGPPGLPEAKATHINDGEVFLAANYAFIEDNGRGRTYVLGLQSVQLDFEHLGKTAEEIATAIVELAKATAAQS